MIQYQKKTNVQNLNRLGRHLKNDAVFLKYGRNITMMSDDVMNSEPVFLKNFGERQPADQIWCFYGFWLKS